MANSIADQIGEDEPLSIIATTLFAYAFSSVLTGELSEIYLVPVKVLVENSDLSV